MKRAVLPILFTIFYCYHVHAWADSPAAKCSLSSETLKEEIKRDGANKSYHDLTRDGRWDALITCIETGDPEWVRIDALLNTAGDGHGGEELNTALGVAFGNQPQNVLKVITHEFHFEISLEIICNAPDIDDERFGTYE
ncbi:MAG: hypothetical protein ACM3ZT_12005, partial [Bacillota bacterium]